MCSCIIVCMRIFLLPWVWQRIEIISPIPWPFWYHSNRANYCSSAQVKVRIHYHRNGIAIIRQHKDPDVDVFVDYYDDNDDDGRHQIQLP